MNEKRLGQHPSKERIASVEILLAVLSGKKLDKLIDSFPAEGVRKNQIYNLCYGTARRHHVLKKYIESKAKKVVGKKTLIIMELSLFELTCNTSAKPYAVVSEALKLMDHFNESSAKPFVNAVLSNFTRNVEAEKKQMDAIPLYPEQIMQDAEAVFGKKTQSILNNFINPSPFFILVNEQKTTLSELSNFFLEKGFDIKEAEYSGLKAISTFDKNIFKTIEFEQGFFIIQDLSSQFAVTKLDCFKGMNMLDVCSAPGGKAIRATILSKDEANITALDKSSARLLRMHENINRLGLKSIEILNQDFESFELPSNGYDRVLVDPPCSALGVLSRNPDIAMRETNENWKSLPKIQTDILLKGLDALKVGGKLVYSVCTFRKAESTEVVSRAIKEKINIDKTFECLTIPNSVNMDGLYVAVLEKK